MICFLWTEGCSLPTCLYHILASRFHAFTALSLLYCLTFLFWSTVYKLLRTLIMGILTYGRDFFSFICIIASSKTANFLWEASMPADSPWVFPLASISLFFLLLGCLESLLVNCRAQFFSLYCQLTWTWIKAVSLLWLFEGQASRCKRQSLTGFYKSKIMAREIIVLLDRW